MNKALILGYGSIGKKHANIIKNLKIFDDIVIYTKQRIKEFNSISNLTQIKKVNPSYIVIASTTNNHYRHLSYCEKYLSQKIILVEKPLFDSNKKLKIVKNTVYVGYNLRFHPIVQRIKKQVSTKNLFNINIQNSSYLPNWRSNIKYFDSSSAKKSTSGGVLFDISHELDLISFLFGEYTIDYVFNKKISNLNIKTDDILIIKAHIKKKFNKKIQIQINLNFFSSIVRREVIIDGKNVSIFGDLVNSNLKISDHTTIKNVSFKKKSEDLMHNSYIEMHKAALDKNEKFICTYNEGLKLNRLIKDIKKKEKHEK